MPAIDRLAARLRRRIVFGEFLRLAGRWISGFLILLGVAVLAVKLFAVDFWPGILWLAGLLPLLCCWLARRAVDLAPAGSRLVSILDDRLGAGGLLMTLAERPDSRWEEELPDADRFEGALPAIIPEPFARAMVIPLMFLAGALALPSRDAPPPAPRATLASEVSGELARALGVLQGSNAIDPAASAALALEIGQLATSIEGGPLTSESWENVDAIRGRLRSALDSADASLLQGELAVSTLASGLGRTESLPLEEMARLGADLERALGVLQSSGALAELSEEWSGEDGASGEGAGMRRLMEDPATREMMLSTIGSLLSEERGELERTRERLAETLDDPRPVAFDPPAELAYQERSISTRAPSTEAPSTQRALTGAARELGGEIISSAGSLRRILLPTDVFAPLIPGPEISPTQNNVAEIEPDPPDGNAIAEAPSAANFAEPEVSTEAFSGSRTWKRQLRPRHRAVVQGYFGEG